MKVRETEREREREREGVLSRARRERALISIVLALRARAQFSSNRPLVLTTVLLSESPCDFAKLYKEYSRVAALWCCSAVHLTLRGAFSPTTRTKRYSLGRTSGQGAKRDGERAISNTDDFVTVSASSTTSLSLSLPHPPKASAGNLHGRAPPIHCDFIYIYISFFRRKAHK